MSIFNRSVFFIFIFVIMLQVLANFNLFNYSISVLLPLIFIPMYLVGILFGPIKFNNISSMGKSKRLFLSLLIILNLIFIPIFQLIFFDNLVDGLGRSSFGFVSAISLLSIGWFLFGYIMSNLNNITLFYCFFIYISLFFSVFLMSTSFNGSIFVDYYYINSLRSDDIRIQHLSLTEPLTILIFLFLSLGYKTKLKWMFLFLTWFLFFSLGGRTAFYCAILTVFIYELIISNALSYLIKIFFIAIVSIIFFTVSNFSDSIFFDKLFFKDGLESDQSYNARTEYLHEFTSGILEQFMIGYPNFFIEHHNDLGTYSHNILSIFQFYGFVLFVLVIYSFLFVIKNINKYNIYKSKNILDVFGILMLIYVLLSVVTGKAVFFPPLWFVLGFLLFRFKRLSREQSYV